MPKKKTDSTEIAFEKAAEKTGIEKYVLRLYIAGITPRSKKAIENVKKICNEYLAGRCELVVIDLYQQPKLAKGDRIVAAPTLIKRLPLPLRRIIGDMSDTEKFLVGIDLKSK